MVFSSFVFLLVFLPLVLAIYYICPDKLRNLVLSMLDENAVISYGGSETLRELKELKNNIAV